MVSAAGTMAQCVILYYIIMFPVVTSELSLYRMQNISANVCMHLTCEHALPCSPLCALCDHCTVHLAV